MFIERMKLVFRRRSKEYSLELIKPDEIDESVDDIVKTGMPGVLRNRDFLKRAISHRESTITIVAKKKGKLMGIVNGIAIRTQPINPQITFVWVKDRKSAMNGVPHMLINRFVDEAKKRKPKAPSIEVNLPTFDVNSITFYSMSRFLIEGFVKGAHGSPDMVIMRRRLGKEPSRTPIA